MAEQLQTRQGVIRYVVQPIYERLSPDCEAYRNRRQVMSPLDQAPRFSMQPLFIDFSEARRLAEEIKRQGFEVDIYEIAIRKIERVGEIPAEQLGGEVK